EGHIMQMMHTWLTRSRLAALGMLGTSLVAVSLAAGVRGLPDPNLTPGAVDPPVTQENIQQTICVPGSTKTVRPPVSVTKPIKQEVMAAYGYAGQAPTLYELDHLVSLELGGAPQDVRNLWPERWTGPHGARRKDVIENQLHKAVCHGTMTLKA